MPLSFKSRISGNIPVDMSGVVPDRLPSESALSLAKQPVWRGNRRLPLGELFAIDGTNDGTWRFAGELAAVHHLGEGMTAGEICVEGDIGRHAGAAMQGGSLHIEGNASDWCGAEMREGTIRVKGNAGDYLGACYVGSRVGMKGGTVVVDGNAGKHTAEAMRRGWITIFGNCGAMPGYRMRAGTLFVFGDVATHVGAEMRRGTIGLFGTDTPTLLPTFRDACRITPIAITILLRDLANRGMTQAARLIGVPLRTANGDLLEGGRGEVYWRAN